MFSGLNLCLFKGTKCNLRKASVWNGVKECGGERDRKTESRQNCENDSQSHRHERSVQQLLTIFCSKVERKDLSVLLCFYLNLFMCESACASDLKVFHFLNIRIRITALHVNKGGCELLSVCLNENKAKLLTVAHFCSTAQVEFPIRESYAGTIYQRPAAPMHLCVVLQHAQIPPNMWSFPMPAHTHTHVH